MLESKLEVLGLDLLDKSLKPPPKVDKMTKVVKKSKTLQLPSVQKWSEYERKCVIPFTLNPYDQSVGYPTRSKYWSSLTKNGMKLRILNFFKRYNDLLLDYFICYELSDKGRFHAHGLMYYDKKNRYDLHHFIDSIKLAFGSRKNKNACFKGMPMNSQKDDAFNKSFNYVTKDVNVMFKSRYHIKYSTKDGIIKILKKEAQLSIDASFISSPQ